MVEGRGFSGHFTDLVARPIFRGSASFVLTAKLKALKPLLKNWNVAYFGIIAAQIDKALNLLNHWDKEELSRLLTNQELEERNSAQGGRNQELWLREGDKNTKFFYKMTNAHSRRNSLVRVKIENGWLTEEGEIKEAVVRHFRNLLTASNGWRLGVDGF